MGEVLSQDEIDNLLKALSTGELDADEMKNTDERQVKDYDFARPAKFSKEHLRTLEIIFEHFGRLLATNLPAYLRKSVSVDVVNSEVVIYSEFSNALFQSSFAWCSWNGSFNGERYYGDGIQSWVCNCRQTLGRCWKFSGKRKGFFRN